MSATAAAALARDVSRARVCIFEGKIDRAGGALALRSDDGLGAAACGIKRQRPGSDRPLDLALLVADDVASAAAVFTTNKAVAAPVVAAAPIPVIETRTEVVPVAAVDVLPAARPRPAGAPSSPKGRPAANAVPTAP